MMITDNIYLGDCRGHFLPIDGMNGTRERLLPIETL